MDQTHQRESCQFLFAGIVLYAVFSMTHHVACGQVASIPNDTKPSTRSNPIVFTKGVHGDLLADLYLPSNPVAPGTLRPAVVFLHGGAWKGGDRTQLMDAAVALADAGYVGMAIDYDTTDKGDMFPVALRESERAVSWLRHHAAQYGVDPTRIAVAGSSAGGELAALLGLESNSDSDFKVAAAVIFNGVLDLSYVGPDAENMVAPYLGGSCDARPQLCREASPVSRVHPGAPPFYIGHGTDDRIVPYRQAETFVRLLQEKHVPVTSFVATGAGHTYWKSQTWFKSNIASVLMFLASSMPSR